MLPGHYALINAFTVAGQDEINELNHLVKSGWTPENIKILVERLKFWEHCIRTAIPWDILRGGCWSDAHGQGAVTRIH